MPKLEWREVIIMGGKLLKPTDVAEKLSFSLATVYRLIDSGKLPVVKIGAALRVRETDLDHLIRVNTECRGTLKCNWRK